MKRVLFVLFAITTCSAFADTYVNGYYRRDGTYVQPHVRSAPNSQRYDNYGSAPRGGSGFGYGYQSPYSRDQDRDGFSNQMDMDDDGDGTFDDFE